MHCLVTALLGFCFERVERCANYIFMVRPVWDQISLRAEGSQVEGVRHAAFIFVVD